MPTVLAMPARDTAAYALSDAQRADWAQVMAVRAEVTRAIEPLRKAGTLGHSLDTHVNLFVDERVDKALASSGADMRAVCIVSALDILPFAKAPVDAVYGELEGLAVEVRKAGGANAAGYTLKNSARIPLTPRSARAARRSCANLKVVPEHGCGERKNGGMP